MDQQTVDYFHKKIAALESAIQAKGQDRLILVQEEPKGPYQMIEIAVTRAGLQTVPFPDVPQLRSTGTRKIIIKGISLVTSDVLTNAPVSGNVNAPFTEIQKMTLIIYCEGWEKAQYLPLMDLNDSFFFGGNFPNSMKTMKFNNWQDVDWNKTKIQLSNGTLTVGAPYSVLLGIDYIVLNSNNEEIVGPG